MIHREVSEPNVIDGIDTSITPAVVVQCPIWSMHRDEELYADALLFRPERWLDRDETARRERHNEWMPFGAGPRSCIGRHFAMAIARSALERLIATVHLDVCARTDWPMQHTTFDTGLSDAMNGVWLRVTSV